jgi:hypothetical protein
MRNDPILEEVRKHRREQAERFQFDIRAIAEDARRREKKSGHKLVTPPPRELAKK